jgi:hypothetical protein
MQRSRMIPRRGSAVPPEPGEVAIESVGWRRVGVLRRLVRTDAEPASLAAREASLVRAERVQRRAA